MPKKVQKDISRPAVVEAIRQGILGGDLVPGQRLVEAEICTLIGASRGTVRSALNDLVHEGLVEHIANRGARVRIVDLEEALQIVEVRMVVESLCVARAAERVTDVDIKSFRAIARQLKKRAADGDALGFAELTHQVFEAYLRIANQPVARGVLERLRAQNSRHRFRLTYRAERARVSLPFWLDIIEAICDRDPDAARAALHRHAQNVEETMQTVAENRTFLSSH